MTTAPAASLPSRLRRARLRWPLIGKLAVVWLAWVLLDLPFEYLRNLGDNLFRPHDLEHAERAVFGGVPTRFLQANLHDAGWAWLDSTTYFLHGLWFGLPFAFALVLSIYNRRLLMEFWSWLLVVCYISAPFFLLFPARPPWMEAGVTRILTNGTVDYASLDANPVAAFPSLHAALPATMALFLFLRFGSRPFFGALATFFTVAISFAVVYLGEHWLIDILAGYALAGLTAFLFIHPWPRAIARRIPGNPVGLLERLNDRWFPAQAEPIAIGTAESESRRAA